MFRKHLVFALLAAAALNSILLYGAEQEEGLAPPEVDRSTQPALTIDSWVPKSEPRRPPPPPETPAPPPPAKTVPPAPAAKKAKAPTVPSESLPGMKRDTSNMNFMEGTLGHFDPQAGILRLSVAGGITAQFDLDKTTVAIIKGRPVPLDKLQEGDKVIVRYLGRVLTAREIEKLSR